MSINWDMLEKMRYFIREDVAPEQFDMQQFFSRFDLFRGQQGDSPLPEQCDSMPCGSVGCTLGHTVLNRELNPDRLAPFPFSNEVLGINTNTCVWTFLFDEYWAEDDGNYLRPEEQLIQAVYRIDQVLKHRDVDREDLEDMADTALMDHCLDLRRVTA